METTKKEVATRIAQDRLDQLAMQMQLGYIPTRSAMERQINRISVDAETQRVNPADLNYNNFYQAVME